MAVPLRIRRNPLAYPAGRAPGFNPAHPAANGICASIVALPSLLRVGAPSAASIVGAPLYVIDGIIGPSQQPSTTNNGVGSPATTFTVSIPASSFATLASICRPLTFSGGSNEFVISANNLLYFLVTSAGLLEVGQSGTNISTGITLTAGVPYFLSACVISASKLLFTVTNLQTGQTVSGSASLSFSISSTTSFVIGNNLPSSGSRVFGGNIAAAMYSTAALSIPQLLQWAADPWSFWYPNDDAFNSLVGVSSSAFLAAWAMQRNQVQQGWAT